MAAAQLLSTATLRPAVSILKPFTFLWVSVTHLHPWLRSFLFTLNEEEMENHL